MSPINPFTKEASMDASKVISSKTSTLPRQQIVSGLTPYSGSWGKSEALHLLRRTTFGNKRADLDVLLGLNADAAVELLFTPEQVPAPPVNEYHDIASDPDVAPGETWVDAPWFEGDVQGYRMRSLRVWWLQRIYQQSLSIHQKLIFFWSSFVTNHYGDSGHAQFCYSHYKLFFDYAFGNYKQFIRAYTILPITLKYLNGDVNVAGAPDENYARELQELFTIGKGPNSGYTEDDVREAARVLTGWTYNWPVDEGFFRPWVHDTGDKQFSSFYNNTVIQGRAGTTGADELDDLMDMIFATEECALYLARRMYTFFVFPEISDQAETDVIVPLAALLRDNNYDVEPALKALLKSEHFFDIANRGVIIKSPLDFIFGTFRSFGVRFPEQYNSLLEKFNTETGPLWLTDEMGLAIGNAPSVAGWSAYYQKPTFDKDWATANTVALRALRTDSLLYWGFWTPGQLLNINVLEFAASFESVANPTTFIEELLEYLLGYNDPDPIMKDHLKAILLSGQTEDYYWTDAWENYVSNPTNEMFVNIVENRIKFMLQKVMQLPEYHLH